MFMICFDGMQKTVAEVEFHVISFSHCRWKLIKNLEGLVRWLVLVFGDQNSFCCNRYYMID